MKCPSSLRQVFHLHSPPRSPADRHLHSKKDRRTRSLSSARNILTTPRSPDQGPPLYKINSLKPPLSPFQSFLASFRVIRGRFFFSREREMANYTSHVSPLTFSLSPFSLFPFFTFSLFHFFTFSLFHFSTFPLFPFFTFSLFHLFTLQKRSSSYTPQTYATLRRFVSCCHISAGPGETRS